jgi:hypothetical protein
MTIAEAAAWTQALLSGVAILAAVGLAWWQDVQRRLEDRKRRIVVRLSAIGIVRLAVAQITVAAERCNDPIERQVIARGFPFYVLEHADRAMAAFPVHEIGHEDGVEVFIGLRAQLESANIRLHRIQANLAAGRDPNPDAGMLVNEARMMREELAKLRRILAPGSQPMDANHPSLAANAQDRIAVAGGEDKAPKA